MIATPINTDKRIRSTITIEKFTGATYDSKNKLEDLGKSTWKFFLGAYPALSGNQNNQISAIPNLGTETAETILVKTTGNILEFNINGLILPELQYRKTINNINNTQEYSDITSMDQITYVIGDSEFNKKYPNHIRGVGDLFRFVTEEMPANDLSSRYQISFYFYKWGMSSLISPANRFRSSFMDPIVLNGYLKNANPSVAAGPNIRLDVAFIVGNAGINLGKYINKNAEENNN